MKRVILSGKTFECTARNQPSAIAVAAGGLMPLEHLLAVMRDPNESEDRRMSAAVAAAPYCHRKLKAIEHTGVDGWPVEYQVHLEFS